MLEQLENLQPETIIEIEDVLFDDFGPELAQKIGMPYEQFCKMLLNSSDEADFVGRILDFGGRMA